MNLKAELEKPKEVTQVAKAAANASEQKFYDLEVQETEAHLTEELVEGCREFCQKMWIEALNLAGVPAASEWRRAKNIYYPSDLRKTPAALLGPKTDDALATTAPKQLSTTQAPLPPPEISKRSSKANDQGQWVEVAKGKKAG